MVGGVVKNGVKSSGAVSSYEEEEERLDEPAERRESVDPSIWEGLGWG